jgi:phage shock protein A
MNLFQRITATLTHTVGSVVAQVENHDAVAEAALKDTQSAAAKAQVRLARLHKDGEAMRLRRQALQQAESSWTQRAVAAAKEDEQKALECVRRRNACREQLEQLAQSLARHEEVEREVGASVARIEQRLQELTQQRNRMRSRHSAADALRVINRIENSSAGGIEDVFDRWEMQIAETEYAAGGACHTDTFESGFLRQEDEAALKADLHELLNAKE